MLSLRGVSVPLRALPLQRQCRTLTSLWDSVSLAPPDPILDLTVAFKKDTFPEKVNVGVGAYRDENGKPWVLPCVEAAAQRVTADIRERGLEYYPIEGNNAFLDVATKFAYGEDCEALTEGRIGVVQTLSGTGALCLASKFLKQYRPSHESIYVPNPTWGNHQAIISSAGLEPKQYRYLAEDGVSFAFDAMMDDVKAAPSGSVFLLHACAHNPTGLDPSHDQWVELADVMLSLGHLPLFDCAYQGFASGDKDLDGFAMREFCRRGVPFLMAQSFAKNFGLYGERVGSFSVHAASADEAERVTSQLRRIIRPMYSSPPGFGSRLVAEILTDTELSADWHRDCRKMADRIAEMRTLLRSSLEAQGSSLNWDHITNQIGMFAYTGLKPEEVQRLHDEFHVYMTRDGRISMAGVTKGNLAYLSHAINVVTAAR